jgi:hypothetical protein
MESASISVLRRLGILPSPGRSALAESPQQSLCRLRLLRPNKHFFGNGIFLAFRSNDVQISELYNKDFSSVRNATDDDSKIIRNYLAIALFHIKKRFSDLMRNISTKAEKLGL